LLQRTPTGKREMGLLKKEGGGKRPGGPRGRYEEKGDDFI